MNILKYIYHDCFLFETPEADLVFDYWREDVPASGPLPAFLAGRSADKPLYVFVSHHHKDHFVKDIFGWRRGFPNIHYILSYDTARFVRHMLDPGSLWKGDKVAPGLLTVMRPGDEWTDGVVSVRAFGSTDIGCSYAVEIDGIRLFHAGDLNAWIWLEESTGQEVAEALAAFTAILKEITMVACRPSLGRMDAAFDVAMFPVDDRMGRGYWTGAKLFLESVPVRRFVPMHFAVSDGSKNAGAVMRSRANAAFRFDLYAPGEPAVEATAGPYGACGFLGLMPGSAVSVGKRAEMSESGLNVLSLTKGSARRQG